MRLRYLLLVPFGGHFPGGSLSELAERTALPFMLSQPDCVLFSNQSGDILALPDHRGVIIGKLFPRHGYPQQISSPSYIDNGSNKEIDVQKLLARYWGSYVAAISIPHGCCIVRDPSGGLPCYYASAGGSYAFASDASILLDAGFVARSVDWDAVGRTLYVHQLPLEQTAVSGMSQIFAGSGLIIRPDGLLKRDYWSPWNHIALRPSDLSASYVDQLRHTVLSTMSAWASCYVKPLVGLSGGLDSSIVAAGLAASHKKPSCLTMTTADPAGDERAYAREVCGAINAELSQAIYRAEDIDLDTSVSEGVPIPCGKIHEQAYNRAIREAAMDLGADSFFIGAGGDNVFYLTHSARPLVDRFMAEGLSRGVLETLHNICAITGASGWQVMREAFHVARRRRSGLRWHVVPDYLHPDFVANERGRVVGHPWLFPPDGVPSGKIGHVTMLLRALNHIEHRDKALTVPMISPLLSQPIVELCLRIPSWEACLGNMDRSVARRAFSPDLPHKIAQRGGKGSPDGFVADYIDRHRPAIAARLLDGKLASQKLLDRPALENILRPGAELGRNDCPRIMALLDVEAWVNHWC